MNFFKFSKKRPTMIGVPITESLLKFSNNEDVEKNIVKKSKKEIENEKILTLKKTQEGKKSDLQKIKDEKKIYNEQLIKFHQENFSLFNKKPHTEFECGFKEPNFYSVKMRVFGEFDSKKYDEYGEDISSRTRTKPVKSKDSIMYAILYYPMLYLDSKYESWPREIEQMSSLSEIKEKDFKQMIDKIRQVYDLDVGLMQFAQFLEYWKGRCVGVSRTPNCRGSYYKS